MNLISPHSFWIVYILECADQTLYTGVTTDLLRRLREHENGKGAKYTKGRGPLTLLYTETYHNRSDASKRELHIKSLTRASKLKLIGEKATSTHIP